MTDEHTDLPRSRLIIRRETVEKGQQAADIVYQAESSAETIREQAEEDAEARRRQGYEDGLHQGHDDAARLAAAAAEATDQFFRAREAELIELSFAIAHRILEQLPPDVVLSSIARTAIAEHRDDLRLTLRVNPVSANGLRTALAQAGAGGRVNVVADDTCQPGSCTLVHDKGRASIGLLDQFRALMANVRGEP